jgi:hypothetical protein
MCFVSFRRVAPVSCVERDDTGRIGIRTGGWVLANEAGMAPPKKRAGRWHTSWFWH